ncbi:oligosaccharide flippase family protein [Pseudoalteromonas sp. SCQQ13]|uniref:oligosaccharide flippase family protein n=1 Tax=Pseudoalteromonas sp. SCQQ13 TaxID=2792066 RepID=UPI0018CCD0FE|nr:oligosaccharide flippase family protein [Pseudoalteromonas sp. SCQQ13]MBH0093516.1 oligosaccharide flippase family protein [Pseudoalteromonas sp. SCQQ13]
MFKKVANLSFIAGITSILNFFLNFILARFYPVEIFAKYGSIFAIVNIAAILTTVGYESLILRFTDESSFVGLLRSSLISFFLASTLVFVSSVFVFVYYYNVDFYESLIWSTLGPFLGISALRVSYYVNSNLQYRAQLLEKLLKTILCVFFISVNLYFFGSESSLGISLSFFCANILVLFISSFFIGKRISKTTGGDGTDFIWPNWALFFIALVVVLQANLDVLLLSKLESEINLALFLVAQKLAIASNIVILTVNTVLVPYVLKSNVESEIKKNLNIGLYISIFASLVFLSTCFLFGRNILTLFGPEYVEADNVLNFIALNMLISVIFGQTFTLMKTWGYEKYLLLFITISILLKISITIIFHEYFSLIHYVIVSIFCTFLWNLLCLIYLKVKTGINPSIFRMWN